jgi:hypothetical protein
MIFIRFFILFNLSVILKGTGTVSVFFHFFFTHSSSPLFFVVLVSAADDHRLPLSLQHGRLKGGGLFFCSWLWKLEQHRGGGGGG